MNSYGINIGHGHCKAIINDGTTEQIMEPFPSQIAHAGDTGALGNTLTVTIDRRVYLVGSDADLGNPITDTTHTRLDNPTLIPALTAGVVQRLGITTPGACVTCLPATWVASPDKKHVLGQRLREGAGDLFKSINVVSEPQAALFSMLLNERGDLVGNDMLRSGRIGIVDIGSATTDVAVVNRLAQEPGSVATWRTGLTRAIEATRIFLETETGRDVSLFEADMAIRTRSITLRGQAHNLPAGWERPLSGLADSIVSDLRKLWGQASHLDTILLAGGGAAEPIITDVIKNYFTHAELVPDPQNSIARGCARRGRMIVEQMTQKAAA